MRIGVPREIKESESRVGLTPAGVRELVHRGHTVMVEHDAGKAIALDDALYTAAGARVVDSAEQVYAEADMVVKVKEPQPQECRWLHAGQVLFTYLHLAADAGLTHALLESGCTAVAYETVTDDHGRLPLLAPMSEVAGRMAIQAGANCLEITHGGNGTLLGGVPGVPPGRVVVLGGGVVGINAARMALGLGAQVTVVDRSLARLTELDSLYGPRLITVFATRESVEALCVEADLVIGAVLVPGAHAPKLVSRQMLGGMKNGAVVVDVAIDQGGCIETSRPTTHRQPTFIVEGVVHYCVANMPGGVARTSTFALTHATLPFVLELAEAGWQPAMRADPNLRRGLNLHAGRLTHEAVAEDLGLPYVAAQSVL